MSQQEKKPLRILFATPYKTVVGGIARVAENIMSHYQSLEQPGVEIDVLPMGRSTAVSLESRLRRAWSGLCDYSGIIREERRMLRQRQYDVLHLCTSASVSLLKDLVMLRVARRYHVRTVVHFHFGRIPELAKARNWEWRLLQRVITLADVAVTIDQMSYDALVPMWGGRVCYLPNPLAKVVADEVKAQQPPVERDERMVLYAGHCIPTKGVCELVSACQQVGDVRLVLAGHIDDDMRRQLLEIAHSATWLEIMGERPHHEVMGLMMRCGVFVLPSYTEGFPNVMLEAMACGCAIVATTVGSIPEMIGEEGSRRFGLLVPPRDTDSLRQALVSLLADEGLREECRQNARERVNERYNMGAVWHQLTRIWQLATAGR